MLISIVQVTCHLINYTAYYIIINACLYTLAMSMETDKSH